MTLALETSMIESTALVGHCIARTSPIGGKCGTLLETIR
jgi:hypothetical protein